MIHQKELEQPVPITLREQSEQNGHVYYPLEGFLIGVKQWLNREGEIPADATHDR